MMSRFRKVVAAVLAMFVAGLAIENAVSMACPMEKSERCGCCDDKSAKISDDANECCSVLSVARRAALPAELLPIPGGAVEVVSIPFAASFNFSAGGSSALIAVRALAPPGVPTFLSTLSIRC